MSVLDVVLYRAGSPWAAPVEDAMLAGFRAHGIEPEERKKGEWRASDLAVVWNHGDAELHAIQHDAGKHYLVMERGYIGDIHMRRKWTSLGFDGLNGRARFPGALDNGERWEEHFGHMMQPWRNGGEYTLIAGQVPGDRALNGLDIGAWIDTKRRELLARGHKVKVRPHPMSGQPDRSLEEDLNEASLVVTYSSNTATDAVLAGVPAVSFDEGSMAWPVTSHSLDEVVRPDRSEWAHRLAWCQWTMEEISSGVAEPLKEIAAWRT